MTGISLMLRPMINVNGGTGDFCFTNNTFTSVANDGYGVRMNGSSSAVITLGDGNVFESANALVLGKGTNMPTGKIIVTGGYYDGQIIDVTPENATAKYEIKGGFFSEKPAEEFVHPDYSCVANKDAATKDEYPWTVVSCDHVWEETPVWT